MENEWISAGLKQLGKLYPKYERIKALPGLRRNWEKALLHKNVKNIFLNRFFMFWVMEIRQ